MDGIPATPGKGPQTSTERNVLAVLPRAAKSPQQYTQEEVDESRGGKCGWSVAVLSSHPTEDEVTGCHAC